MTEQQYTPDGLPVITEATYLSLVDIIRRDLKKDEWGREMREKILQENPHIYSMINDLIKSLGKTTEFTDGVAFGAFMTYMLLTRQSATYQLGRTVGEQQ